MPIWFQLLSSTQKRFGWFLVGLFLLALGVMMLSIVSGDSVDLIVSDANGYYAWTRSILLDGDVDFRNDYALLYSPDPLPSDMARLTPRGLPPNKYPIGMAILTLPGFVLGHLIALVTPFIVDGASLPYQVCVTVSLVLLVLLSFWLFFQALLRSGIPSATALLVSSLSLVGTNLLHYITKEPAMAHGAGVALLNGLVWFSTQQTFWQRRPRLASGMVGGISGLLIVVRLSNLVFLPFIAVLFSTHLRQPRNWPSLLAGGSFFLLIQQLVYFWLWGKVILYPYKGEGFYAGLSGIRRAVVGQAWGVFLHHPWYFVLVSITLVGLFICSQHQGLLATALIGFTGLWLLNGLWDNFANSFGHRAFIETLPALSWSAALVLATGRSFLSKIWQWSGVVLAGGLIFLNGHIWLGYLLNAYDHNPHRTLAEVYFWIWH
ncbi:MAG: hypothetical protein AAGG51_09500 [Cyanobacteria bacterium P01_G01_bin.54]